jgi:hypothetical protein
MMSFNERDLVEAVESLREGHDKLEKYLGGKNKRGLLTNISNNILLLKEYVEYKGYDKTIIDEVWNKKRVD